MAWAGESGGVREAIEQFRDVLGDVSPALEEVLEQLEMLDRRSLIECEVEDDGLVVRSARGGRTIARMSPLGAAMSEPMEGDLDDPGYRHAFVLGVEARALQLLREPAGEVVAATSPPTEKRVEMGGSVRGHAGKYRKLWSWLRKQDADVIPITFARIEEILGMPLPPSSRKHAAHWSGYDNSAVSRAIVDAGFKTRKVDLRRETVEFYRA